MAAGQSSYSVFICPQHWGLGHITRTVPIIEYFITKGFRVVLGCSGAGSALLKKEFPALPIYDLPDYGINYPTSNMYWNMGIQIFKLHKAIIQEKKAIHNICKSEKIDLIVSDSRFGASQKGIPSAIVAHHLFLPLGVRLVEWITERWMRFFYKQFDQIWIPDFYSYPNLSGKLSHQFNSDMHYFIGPLSRLKKAFDGHILYDIAIILSGPEPQRAYFEQLLLDQIKGLADKRIILVRGVETQQEILDAMPVKAKGLSNRFELNEILNQAALVVCRSGYTSIMDLSVLRKPALMVPTPGQPEQEYLAEELEKNKIFHCVDQKHLDLSKDVAIALSYNGFQNFPVAAPLAATLDPLVEKLFEAKKFASFSNK